MTVSQQTSSSNSNASPGSKGNSNGLMAQLNQFKVLIIILGAFAGYLFTQGYFSPYYHEKFSYNILLRPVLAISYESIIRTGLPFIFEVLVEFLAAYIILFGLYVFGQFLSRQCQFKFPSKTAYYLLNGLTFSYFLFLPLFYQLFFHVFEPKTPERLAYLELWNVFADIILLGGFFLFRRQGKQAASRRLKPFIKLFGLFFLLSTVCFVPFIILYNGYLSYYEVVEYAMRDRKGMDYSKVYLTDEKNTLPTGYFTLELTKDFFTGWDDQKKAITIIPTNAIAKIEKWQAVHGRKRPVRYGPDLTEAQIKRMSGLAAAEVEKMIAVVKNFYTYRTGVVNRGDSVSAEPEMMDAGKVLPLLTQRCREHFIEPLFSPAVLTAKWRKTKTFHSNNLSDFNGFNLSLPEKAEEGRCEIFAHECWRDFEDQFLQFVMLKNQNGQWLIDAVDIIDTPFRFREAK
jgi:hypothetical protein